MVERMVYMYIKKILFVIMEVWNDMSKKGLSTKRDNVENNTCLNVINACKCTHHLHSRVECTSTLCFNFQVMGSYDMSRRHTF